MAKKVIKKKAKRNLTKSNNTQPRGVQVIARAAEILRTLEGIPEGLSLGQIAEEVGLARSTVQRIVGALATERFLIAASPKARVRLGPGLVSLGSAARLEIAKIIHPYLERLSKEVGETVDLSILDGRVILFIDQAIADVHRLQAVSAIGMVFQSHSCAPGKAILAAMDEGEREKSLAGRLKADTEHTITSIEDLNKEFSRIRNSGIAYDKEEHTIGICAVGSRLVDQFGRNLAISIPVPSVRFNKKAIQLERALKKYVDIIENALGKSNNS